MHFVNYKLILFTIGFLVNNGACTSCPMESALFYAKSSLDYLETLQGHSLMMCVKHCMKIPGCEALVFESGQSGLNESECKLFHSGKGSDGGDLISALHVKNIYWPQRFTSVQAKDILVEAENMCTTTAVTQKTKQERCQNKGYTYLSETMCVAFITGEAKTWHKAREECISHGGDLITLNTEVRFMKFYNFLKKSGNTDGVQSGLAKLFGGRGRDMQIWMGLRFDTGSWQWVDGSPLTYSKFAYGTSPKQNFCVKFGQGPLKLWYCVPCSKSTKKFGCEIKLAN